MSSKPSMPSYSGPTEAQLEARKAKRLKRRTERANEGKLSRGGRSGFRGTVLTSQLGLGGDTGQQMGGL